MAYILKRKGKKKVSYRALVQRRGFKHLMKSFSTRTDAKKWARAIERKLDTGDYTDYSEAFFMKAKFILLLLSDQAFSFDH